MCFRREKIRQDFRKITNSWGIFSPGLPGTKSLLESERPKKNSRRSRPRFLNFFNWKQPKGGPKPPCRHFCPERIQIQFSPIGKFRTGRAIFFRPTPNFFANRLTEVGCGVKVVGAAAFGEDGCQERCRAAETTRTPRASSSIVSITFGRNPAPLLPF